MQVLHLCDVVDPAVLRARYSTRATRSACRFTPASGGASCTAPAAACNSSSAGADVGGARGRPRLDDGAGDPRAKNSFQNEFESRRGRACLSLNEAASKLGGDFRLSSTKG